MISASDRLVRACLRGGYESATRVEWQPLPVQPGAPWRLLQTIEGYEVALTGGQVLMDRKALVRRTGALALGGRSADPKGDPSHPLGPRSRLRVLAGARFADGSVERVSLGVFRITGTSGGPGGKVDVGIADEMSLLAGAGLRAAVTIPAGSSALDCLRRLLTSDDSQIPGLLPAWVEPALPWCGWSVDPGISDATLGDDLLLEGDRLEAVDTLANMLRATVACDAEGDLRVAPRTVRSSDPAVLTLEPGELGTYSEISWAWSMDGFANEVAVRWEEGVEVATATTGSLTPALLGSTIRRVWDVTDSGGSQAHAAATASDALATYYGLQRQVKVATPPLPFIEAGDRLDVRLPSGEVLAQVVDSLAHPLAPSQGPSTYQMREWREAV
jgi:hypothetical protein